jgi:hypothetical protein
MIAKTLTPEAGAIAGLHKCSSYYCSLVAR